MTDPDALALIDIGNSNIVVALARDEAIVHRFRLPSDGKWTADLYEIMLRALLAGEDRADDFAAIGGVALASTVPTLTDRVAGAAERVFGREVVVLNRHRDALGIEIDIDQPEEAGVDRVVNALAARARYGAPAIVVDIGTGTTFDVVGSNGAYIGGAIAAGPALSLESLHRVAAQLPKIEIARPERVIGRTTLGAMRSGFYWAYVGMIQFMCRRIAEELGARIENVPVIVSGGYAAAFCDSLDMPSVHDPDITLRGMTLAYRRVVVGAA